jgi:hypothetical protein
MWKGLEKELEDNKNRNDKEMSRISSSSSFSHVEK